MSGTDISSFIYIKVSSIFPIAVYKCLKSHQLHLRIVMFFFCFFLINDVSTIFIMTERGDTSVKRSLDFFSVLLCFILVFWDKLRNETAYVGTRWCERFWTLQYISWVLKIYFCYSHLIKFGLLVLWGLTFY